MKRLLCLLVAMLLPAFLLPGRAVAAVPGHVRVCGTQLCEGAQRFVIHGATAYGQYDDPAREIALAKKAHVNVIELVEFDTQFHVLSDTMSDATWRRVDR